MDKRKKIKSKDDVTWIKPETKKRNQSAAKCAQNKYTLTNKGKVNNPTNQAKSHRAQAK